MHTFLRRLTERPERIFLFVASFFGLLTILLTPALTAPDEGAHFWVSYGMFSEEEQIPKDLLVSAEDSVKSTANGAYFEDYFEDKANLTGDEIRFNIHKDIYLNAENESRTASSFDITHLPQATGILIGKVVYPSVGVMTTFGRLTNLIFFLVAIFFIIKRVNYGKLAFAFVALFPIIIQQAGSLSYDVINIVVIFGWIALMINLFSQTSAMTKRQALLLVVLAVGLAVTKTSNLLLLGLVAVLPPHLYASFKPLARLRKQLSFKISRKARRTIITALLVVGFLAGIVLFEKYLDTRGIGFWQFIGVFFNTFFRPEVNTQLDPVITSGLVGNFGWLWYRLPQWLVILHLIAFVIILLGEKAPQVSKCFAIASTALFITSVIGITLAMYFLWTLDPGVAGSGAAYIQGMQGRYFTPLLVLLIPGAVYLQRHVRVAIDQRLLVTIVAGMAVFSLTVYMVLTYIFFYTPADGVKNILLG